MRVVILKRPILTCDVLKEALVAVFTLYTLGLPKKTQVVAGTNQE